MRVNPGRAALAAAAAGVFMSMGISAVATVGASPATSPGVTADRVISYVPVRGRVQAGPLDTAFTNVDYNGGPVMPKNTDYLVFWSPSGYGAYGTGSPPQYVSGLEQYIKDLAHDSGGNQNTDSVSAQYNDATGATAKYAVKYGGAILDTDAYPASQCPAVTPVTNCLTDAQIQAEIESVVAANHLKTDLGHEYFLLTPPHVEGCFNSNAAQNPPYGGCSAGEPSGLALYCAYHQQTSSSPMVFYADQPYVTGNSGCDDGNHPNGPSDGALNGGLSHEQNESVSDPIPNDAWTNGAGNNHGQEIGDQCDTSTGPLYGTPLGTHNGAKYNQVINGHFYWYQEEWSNSSHQCLQRFTPPTTLPTAKFTVTAGTGTSMTFNASASTAPGGVADYVWQFNAVNSASTVEQTTPTITYSFPAAGAYSVGLTIYASDGTSRGAGAIVTTGHNGFSHGLTSTASGLTVTFHGLTNVSGFAVSNYLWEFGDGTTGTGATPSHTYAVAGTYKVTVVLFSGVGSAFPGSGAAPIYMKKITVS